MSKKTPEERAAENATDAIRPSLFSGLNPHQIAQRRLGYMKAWVEKVEPLEELVQKLVDAASGEIDDNCDCDFCARVKNAIASAKELGFVPTNTQDNG
jgi:hypothetical protein